MSYYFSIISPHDTPLFSLEFGTSKANGDGIPRFTSDARAHNPFIVHSSLDFVDELQYTNTAMYLKRVDHFASAHISCFLTPTDTRFMLLHLPHPPNTAPVAQAHPNAFPPFVPYTSTLVATGGGGKAAAGGAAGIPNNPTSPQTEEAIRQFFGEVFEVWLKAVMNPFARVSGKLGSPVFKARVVAAGRKYL